MDSYGDKVGVKGEDCFSLRRMRCLWTGYVCPGPALTSGTQLGGEKRKLYAEDILINYTGQNLKVGYFVLGTNDPLQTREVQRAKYCLGEELGTRNSGLKAK